MTAASEKHSWIPFALAGLAASMVGIGIARFSYTPLLPALIDAGWFSETDAVYLGAVNLAGYLVGALSAAPLGKRFRATRMIPLAMLIASVSLLACAEPAPFAWFFVWRAVAGITGGIIMVLAGSVVLAAVPKERRGVAGGILFTGVGLGIAISGTLVPALIAHGLTATWLSLGAVSLIATVASYAVWRRSPPRPKRQSNAEFSLASATRASSPRFLCLHAVYGLVAFGLVPHMIFLVDYVARGLALGLDAGGALWVTLGIGTVAGPLAAGRLADAIGFRRALLTVVTIAVAAVGATPLVDSGVILHGLSFIVGSILVGIVPLIAGRVHEIAGTDDDLGRLAWGHATIAFSVGQATGAYAISYLFETTGRYGPLFAVGAAAVFLAMIFQALTPKDPAPVR